jgi:hypothetical protein
VYYDDRSSSRKLGVGRVTGLDLHRPGDEKAGFDIDRVAILGVETSEGRLFGGYAGGFDGVLRGLEKCYQGLADSSEASGRTGADDRLRRER